MRGVARRVAHLATAGDDVGLGEGRDDTERSEPVVDVVAELGGRRPGGCPRARGSPEHRSGWPAHTPLCCRGPGPRRPVPPGVVPGVAVHRWLHTFIYHPKPCSADPARRATELGAMVMVSESRPPDPQRGVNREGETSEPGGRTADPSGIDDGPDTDEIAVPARRLAHPRAVRGAAALGVLAAVVLLVIGLFRFAGGPRGPAPTVVVSTWNGTVVGVGPEGLPVQSGPSFATQYATGGQLTNGTVFVVVCGQSGQRVADYGPAARTSPTWLRGAQDQYVSATFVRLPANVATVPNCVPGDPAVPVQPVPIPIAAPPIIPTDPSTTGTPSTTDTPSTTGTPSTSSTPSTDRPSSTR